MNKSEAIALGATGLRIPTQGLRLETLEYLRSGRPVSPALPVTIMFYPDGSRAINDGRHRIMLAREEGKRTIRGVIKAMGPRGGIQWSYTGNVPI